MNDRSFTRNKPFSSAKALWLGPMAAALLCASTAASAAVVIPATHYSCHGQGVTVSYFTGGTSDVASVAITLGAEVIKAQGADVLIQQSPLGSLVTVRHGSVSDSHTDTLTLLAPDVNVPAVATEVPAAFLTTLFSTRSFTSIGGPALVPGVIQQSRSQPVSCKASAPSSAATD
jgi:hypothetical protein